MFCDCNQIKKNLLDKISILEKQLAYVQGDLELLMQHLKLEVNGIPATERKRVIVKLGTHVKKMKEFDAALATDQCACRGSYTNPGSTHGIFSCKSKP